MPKNVPPRFVLLFWPLADRLLRAVRHIRPLIADDSGIIRFNVGHYRGPARVLNDGTEVKVGDTIVEVHLNNDWFKRRRNLNLSASQSPREFLGCYAEELRILARQVAGGMFGDIVALRGVTLLDVAARRLGFQVDELPDSLWKRGARFYMVGLVRVYHLRGGGVPMLREKAWEVKEIWLSKKSLLSRYGSGQQ